MESRTYEILTKGTIVLTLAIMTRSFILDGLSVWETAIRMTVFVGLILLVRKMERNKRKFLEEEIQKLRLELKGWAMTKE